MYRVTAPKGHFDFLCYDTYLSPFTSCPVYALEKLLFTRPFERIYEDSYLIDDAGIGYLVNRAYAIYTNFSEIVAELYRASGIDKDTREIQTMQYIFHWNVASTRFDNIIIYLNNLYAKNIGSGNYHLRSNNMQIEIFDLENNNQLLTLEETSGLLPLGNIPHIYSSPEPVCFGEQYLSCKPMDDPFRFLRPSFTFETLDYRSELITVTEILQLIESRIAESEN